MSASEEVFWSLVRKDRLGIRFRRQVSVAGYFLDFYCAAAQVAVEIDGEQHQRSEDYDRQRDSRLRAVGVEVFRIPSLVLFEKSSASQDGYMESLERLCTQRIATFAELRESKRSKSKA
jgi:very-short-patch-repair endonuclease